MKTIKKVLKFMVNALAIIIALAFVVFLMWGLTHEPDGLSHEELNSPAYKLAGTLEEGDLIVSTENFNGQVLVFFSYVKQVLVDEEGVIEAIHVRTTRNNWWYDISVFIYESQSDDYQVTVIRKNDVDSYLESITGQTNPI